MKQISILSFLICTLFLFSTCSKSPGGGVNVFSINDDIELGAKVKAEIEADPVTYPIIPDDAAHKFEYDYIRAMRDKILASGQVTLKDKFLWEIKLIRDDKTLNAFCTPGGYIYIYTGLIKYLDNGDELAGVLGHEIAHADLRHSTDAMTRQYGINVLLEVVLGKNQGTLTNIAKNLLELKYSKNNESQADEYSVKYLSGTTYNCAGAAGFFEKLIAEQTGSSTPAFLSTHPSPENRVENINKDASDAGCKKEAIDLSDYAKFKAKF